MCRFFTCFSLLFFVFTYTVRAQEKVLTLKKAVEIAVKNFGSVRARANYVKASGASVTGAIKEYLPDVSVSIQQSYGTINGQSGPQYGLRGLSASSAGPPMETQNWHSAFGALYLANINWDFFSFGRVRERINVAKSMLKRDETDLEQVKFQHQVRVAAAYLNLLAAQRLTRSQENNLERAGALRAVVVTRTKTGLNAGVDSSLANAEVSSAKIAFIRSQDFEQEQATELSRLMGVDEHGFVLDSLFISRIPLSIFDSGLLNETSHPILSYFNSLVNVSEVQEKFLHTSNYPTFSLFSIFQARGSGFDHTYGPQFPDAYTRKYLEGVQPRRTNYLAGLGVVWNLTSPLRVQHQVASQRFTSLALKDDLEQAGLQLKNQLVLARNKINNAMANYREVPVQMKAAGDAYLQKSVLYKNGLTNIVDVTQALYALNRAETDRDIAYNNVWQALLLKASALGDFGLFINEF